MYYCSTSTSTTTHCTRWLQVREKDGLWAVLAWLSILAHKNKDIPDGEGAKGVADVAMEHWQKFGRNFFMRYDYEGLEAAKANKVIDEVRAVVAKTKKGDKIGSYTVDFADDFSYTDPVDGSVTKGQGLRFVFSDGSRIVFRCNGLGLLLGVDDVSMPQYCTGMFLVTIPGIVCMQAPCLAC
jgi:phosphoglucomutase